MRYVKWKLKLIYSDIMINDAECFTDTDIKFVCNETPNYSKLINIYRRQKKQKCSSNSHPVLMSKLRSLMPVFAHSIAFTSRTALA